MEIIQAHAVKNLCYVRARKMIPQGIVVHSTGANNPYLKRYVDCEAEVGKNKYGNHWNTPTPEGRKVCVHGFIGYDKNKAVRVAEILPLNICCWGVGNGSKGSYNYDPPYIQFEICEDGLDNIDYYRQAFQVAEEYCAHLCEKFGLTPGQIVSHAEAYRQGYGCNHSDPEHWMKKFGEDMADFRSRVAQRLENGKEIFRSGDLVCVAENAVYYTGKRVPDWVQRQNWYIESICGHRAVLNENESQTNAICSPIHTQFLRPVHRPEEYLVKIHASKLNIRKAPSTNSKITGHITDRGVYTIVAEASGPGASLWGKLKSGAGWIALDYAQKTAR